MIKDSELLPNNYDNGLRPVQMAPGSSELLHELQITRKDVIPGSSEMCRIKAPHILDQSEKQDHEPSHKFKDASSITVASSKLQEAEARLHVLTSELNHSQLEVVITQKKTSKLSDRLEQVIENRGLVDTTAPFESVKEAVTKFGGHVDWKALKAMTLQKQQHVQHQLQKIQEEVPKYKKQSEIAEDAKAEVLKELDTTKRLIEELKLSLAKAQTQEALAKQDSEIADLRVKEMKLGIANDASVAATRQLEASKERPATVAAELKSAKDELEALKREYCALVNERNVAIGKAAESFLASKEIEKILEDLTLELITTKESLESAQGVHLEAEEQRISASLAWEQDKLNWEKELKQVEGELQHLNEQLLLVNDIKLKLDTASALLFNLKSEFAAYMQEKLSQQSEGIREEKPEDEAGEKKTTLTTIPGKLAQTKRELGEVKTNIEKAKDEVNCLRVTASSLKCELERETAVLTTMRQREGLASVSVSSLEAELKRTNTELERILMEEKEAQEKMVDVPKILHQAAQEADHAKSITHLARQELAHAKEEAEQAKAGTSTMEIRLDAALKEIEAAKASEKLALSAVKALEASEQAAALETNESPSVVSLPLDEYYSLSKKACEAEELANRQVIAAIKQIKSAKESESKCLEKLEEANRKTEQKKKALTYAMEKAEKAKEGKLGVEQEWTKWRSEHEGLANSSYFEETGESNSLVNEEISASYISLREYLQWNDTTNIMPQPNLRRKLFFPRIVMSLARKKAQSLK